MLEITLRLPADRPAILAVDTSADGLHLHVPSGVVIALGQTERFADGGIARPVPGGVPATLERGQVRPVAAPAAAPKPRFIKIDAAGDRLAADAKQWAGVLDTQHQLLWSAEEVGSERVNHADATKACAELILCGGPARLPTRAELLTLVDDTRHEPAIDLAFFPSCRSNWYWTSTPAAWSPASFAWLVYFDYGSAGSGPRDGDAFVRAVRSVCASPGQ